MKLPGGGSTRKLATTHPHLAEFSAFLDDLNRESDRGAVLIACSMIDELLSRSIRADLLDDGEWNGDHAGRRPDHKQKAEIHIVSEQRERLIGKKKHPARHD